jgi:site-specific recombinase XerC
MAYGGLRISEVMSLKLDKINLVKGIIYVKGKGSKRRGVPMLSLIKEALKYYLFCCALNT